MRLGSKAQTQAVNASGSLIQQSPVNPLLYIPPKLVLNHLAVPRHRLVAHTRKAGSCPNCRKPLLRLGFAVLWSSKNENVIGPIEKVCKKCPKFNPNHISSAAANGSKSSVFSGFIAKRAVGWGRFCPDQFLSKSAKNYFNVGLWILKCAHFLSLKPFKLAGFRAIKCTFFRTNWKIKTVTLFEALFQ